MDQVHYYGRDGAPISMEEWAGQKEEKHVGLTRVGDFVVSTVHLGLNHQYGDGPPLIFETIVFPVGSFSEEDMDGYSTEAEALAGHKRMVGALEGTPEDLEEWPE